MWKPKSIGHRKKARRLSSRGRIGKPAGRGDHRQLRLEPLEQRQLLSAGGTEQLTNLFGFESDVAVDPNDPLIVATSQFQTVLVSRDGGRTFPTTVNLNAPAPYVNTRGGDPTLSFDSQGNLYFGYLSNNGAPANANFTIGVFGAVIDPQTGNILQNTQIAAETNTVDHDKEWVAADHWQDSPFRDNAYMVWSLGNNGIGGNNDAIAFSRTTNGGANWSVPINISPGGQGFIWPSEVSVARNGDVWAAWHTNTGNLAGNLGGIAMRRSSDGGVTFQPQVTPFPAGTADITDNTPPNPLMPGNRSWMQGAVQPRILLDPVRPNNIYVIAVDDPDNNYAAGDPADIVMARSTNYGASWTRSTMSHAPFGTIQTMPSAAIDEDGDITVMWYDSRNGQPSVGVDQILGNADDNLLLDLYATVSLDGGLTWSNDFQVNENPFDPDLGPPNDRWPPNNIFRIGEYNGHDADSGYAYVSWTANNGNNQDISFDVFSALSAFPDRFEENDTLETATFLGSDTVIQHNGLTIHPGDSADDEDFFLYSAHTTGKLLVHIDFLDRAGNLDLQIQDTLGNQIILANSTSDNETVVIPVVAGQDYVVRVFGVGGNTNRYDLEIENFPAPIPTGGFFDPASDTGRSNADNITNDDQPQMFIVADVLNFVDTNHNDTRDPGEITALTAAQAGAGTTAGAAVEVWLTNTSTRTTVKGFADPLDTSIPVLYSFTPGAALADGVYVVMAATRIFDGQRNAAGGSSPADARTQLSAPLLQFTVDTQAPPVSILDIDPASTDTGVDGFSGTLADRITSDTATGFYGRAEADAVVRLYVDADRNDAINTPTQFSLTVAVPLDGNQQFPDGQWSTSYIHDLNAPPFPRDGVREVLVRAEDVAGNVSVLGGDDILDIFIDTQGPQIYDPPGPDRAIQIGGSPDYNLFDPKEAGANPDAGPTPLVNSLVINVQDLPNRVTDFLYNVLVNGGPTFNLGNYLVQGDHNGVIPIQSVTFNPDVPVNGQPATGTIELTFPEPLLDDRYTLTISDSLVDPAGNRLDGESNAIEPQDPPLFPTGDMVLGGDFVARFTVDSRPEIAVWGAGNVWVDTNGNFFFDPNNPDFTNRDIVYSYSQGGFTSDEVFAGKFAALPGADAVFGTDDDVADGFDTLAVYGKVGNQYRWMIDTDNDGVLDFQRDDPANINGFPVAGEFQTVPNPANGDEVGLFTGTHWYLDRDRDFRVDPVAIESLTTGYPIVGDFDGDGLDDLGTWRDDSFFFDLANDGLGVAGDADGLLDDTIAFGFIGVRDRPVAADFDGDGIDDVGLWVPDRPGAVPEEAAEWYFLISDDHAGAKRVVGQVITLDHPFEPVPFGKDLFAQYGDEFAVPVVGNFDPPPTAGLPAAEVVGRHTFYNHSDWDDPLKGRDNDHAIAPDKTALLPGETAAFDNYTSYDKGINGIIVDVASPLGTISAADFEFKVGNDNQPENWSPIAPAPTVEVRPGQGTHGSDRVTIVWPDGAIQNQWLEVTVLAANIGLAADDVFYFGNAVAESGNSAGSVVTPDAIVNVQDVLATRSNPHPFWDPAQIDTVFDYNRDERVDATDILIARASKTWSFNALKLIDLSDDKAAGAGVAGHDAAIEQAVGQESDGRQASSAKTAWLYQFQPINTSQRSSKPDNSLQKAVDELLAGDWL